ncbi:hypothetical protein WN944_006839 [Citrus x changshan-huyou]|uniref:Uncharacterized protein n=1 Tax=Citrus x changshan-huyou TaxID=2935761 RepID=A0AAP0MM39_9ROSI
MEMAEPDHVVLSIDQQNANNPSMQTELNREPNKILPLEKNSLSFSAPDLHQIPATRKQTPHRLSFSKPKSRLLELKYPLTAHSKTIPESNEIEPFLDDNDNSNIYSTHVDDNEWDKELKDDSEDEDVGTESKQRKEIGSPIGDFLRNWYYFSSLWLVCIRNCMWLGLVLLAWTCIFNEKLHKKNKMLEKVFRALVAMSLGATIWLIVHCRPTGRKEVRNVYKSKRFRSREIDMEKLRKLSMETTASTWSMKRLVSYIKFSGSSTISKTDNYFGKGRIGDYK